MAIDKMPLPAPHRGMPDETFSPAVDAWLSAIPRLIDQINAVVDAMNMNSTNATASAPMTVSGGTKSFTTQTGKSFVKGQTIKIASISNAAFWMLGDVMSYDINTGAIVVNVQYTQNPTTTDIINWQLSLAAPAPVTIPIGSVTVWYQAVAPVGWTQITTHNNKSLRIVSGAGGGSGGTVTFTDAFTSQAVSGTVGQTTLATTQIPSHQHTYTDVDNAGSVSTGASWIGSVGNIVSKNTNLVGGSGSHGHAFTGTAINLAVQYLDMILARKD